MNETYVDYYYMSEDEQLEIDTKISEMVDAILDENYTQFYPFIEEYYSEYTLAAVDLYTCTINIMYLRRPVLDFLYSS